MHKKVTISLPVAFLHQLDAAAKSDILTRSAYICEAVSLKIELDATIESEVSDRGSYVNMVRRMHYQRLSQRRLREMGPLSWSQAQD